MVFCIERGNIVHCDTDAIVLPANTMLKEGSGTSHAIFSAAGRSKLTKACKGIKVPLEVGMAVPTSGYNLKASFIIHAVVPKWIDGSHNEYELLSTAYRSSLEMADQMKCRSIAFPLLAAGNNKFERSLAFQIAIENIRAFEPSNLTQVKLIVFDEEMEVFVRTQGYDVTNRFVLTGIQKAGIEAKNAAKDFLNDALQRGLDFINDEENRKKILDVGIAIAIGVINGMSENNKA